MAIGEDVSRLREVFGEAEPAEGEEPVVALDAEADQDFGPPALRLSDPEDTSPPEETFYRYEGIVFIAADDEIGAFLVTDDDASTRHGAVAIGDLLDVAERAYALRCGAANANTESVPYPACTGRLASGLYVWFGGDPIRNITISRRPLEGL